MDEEYTQCIEDFKLAVAALVTRQGEGVNASVLKMRLRDTLLVEAHDILTKLEWNAAELFSRFEGAHREGIRLGEGRVIGE